MDGTICNKGGLNFSRVGFFWRGEITVHNTFMEIYVSPFLLHLSSFDFLFVVF